MTTPVSLWIVDDEPGYREPFGRLIATTDAFRLDAEFETYEDLVSYVEATSAAMDRDVALPDIVVMDLKLPGVGGVEATGDLLQRWPDVTVVVVTTSDDPASVFAVLRAGARGYVVKGTEPDRMFRALLDAHAGCMYFPPSVARHVQRHFAAPDPLEEPLSSRESEVLSGLVDGLSKAGIAERLNLSPHTVDTHLRNVYRKLHVKTAAAAAAKGVRNGLV